MLGCAAKKPRMISFRSPEETFETWRQAAEVLDLQTLLACYSAKTQQTVEDELKSSSSEALKEMQKETKRTKFQIEKVIYEKDRAYLRTTRRLAKSEDVEVLLMVKEGQDWKLVP